MPSLDEKKEAKRGRRKLRFEIMKRMERVAMRRMKCFARNAQIKAAAKVLTDRYMHQVDHAPATVQPVPAAIPERQAPEVEVEVNG